MLIGRSANALLPVFLYMRIARLIAVSCALSEKGTDLFSLTKK